MTVGGWIIMVVSVGGVVALLGWCVSKVLSTPGASQHVHSQADIDTRDRDRD
jgi:hypothetical protein